MTAEPDLLPLPEWTKRDDAGQNMVPSEIRVAMNDYARACVAHATAAKDAEVEALRAEVEKWRSTAVFGACGLSDHLTEMEERATAAEARAERLAEALRLYMSAGFGNSTDFYKQAEAKRAATEALHPTAAQEGE